MASLVDINSLQLNQQISFKTQHMSDNTVYEGIIVGFYTYDVAKTYYDLVPYYQVVKKSLPNIAPIETLTYFMLQYTQGDKKAIFVCAKEWVLLSSLKIIELNQKFDIRIYNQPETEVQTILELLQSHGYSCTRVIE